MNDMSQGTLKYKYKNAYHIPDQGALGKQGKNNVPHVTLAWQTVVCRNEFKKRQRDKREEDKE